MAKVKSPNQQHAANYGTAANPALIQTPNHNGPNPRPVRAYVAPADGTSLQDRLLAQQWRDVLASNPDPRAVNRTNPDGTTWDGDGESPDPGAGVLLHDNGDGTWTSDYLEPGTDGTFDARPNGVLTDNHDGTFSVSAA